MELMDSIFVMNEQTWKTWQDGILKEVETHKNPMPYMKLIARLEVLIDNALPNEVIEVYYKDDFDSLEDE